jgi:competence protein ComEA
MGARAETLLTLTLLAVCAGLVGVSVYPRLTVQAVPVEFEYPDVTVSVMGEVGAPGTYTLPWGSRVEDLVAAAGGMTDGAEPTMVNLADPLTTGEAVLVPGVRTLEGEARVSLNTASERELDLLLPGVGPVLAARIAAARPFTSVEDLLNVSGIGEATLEKLRPYVRP